MPYRLFLKSKLIADHLNSIRKNLDTPLANYNFVLLSDFNAERDYAAMKVLPNL